MNKLHVVSDEKEILINKMYTGSYLKQRNNIGHEVINLIKADNNKGYYIYINPYGTMEKEHYSSNPDNPNVDTVLLVRPCELDDAFEVIAQVWGLHETDTDVTKQKTWKIDDIASSQEKYIKKNKIRYNGKLLNKIFKNNDKNIPTVFYTYRADYLVRPKYTTYISFAKPNKNQENLTNGKENNYILIYLNPVETEGKEILKDKDNKIILEKKDNSTKLKFKSEVVNIAKQSLKMYIKNDWVEYSQGEITSTFDEFAFNFNINDNYKSLVNKDDKTVKITGKIVNQKHVFRQLKDFLENPYYWENVNRDIQSYTDNKSEYFQNNFIDLVDKQYAEVTYSNLFQYIFSTYPDLLRKFVDEKLGIKLNLTENIEIIREEAHIDLLIVDKENVIVIENKIKSDINGKKYDEFQNEIRNQLVKYCEYVYLESLPKDSAKKEILINRFDNKKRSFFIFAPNYNRIALKSSIPVKYKNEKYTIKTYKDIFDFFNEDDIKKEYGKKLYFKEFLYSLEKHINSTDNAMELEMFRRFSKITK